MSWDKEFSSVRPRIDADLLKKLSDAHVADLEQLQDRFYVDLDCSLRKAEQVLGVGRGVLAGLIAKSLVGSSEPLINSWTRRHWTDSVLLLMAVYVGLALVRPWLGLWIPKKQAELTKPVPQVVTASLIPKYGMIRDDSLLLTSADARVLKEQMTAPLVGRYALSAIPAGTAVTEDKLSRKRSDLSGQSIVQLEIKRDTSLDGHELPEEVDLLFSARQGGPAGTSVPGRLLAVDMKSTPPVAAVALSKNQADAIAKWIGSSDIYLSLRER